MAVFDIEGDSLTPTKIHCVVYERDGKHIVLTKYEEMRKFFLSEKVLIAHNLQRFDIPTVERLLSIKVKAQLIDTLALSWYLEPKRVKHGLAEWGEEFGVPKPKVDDWENLPLETYIHRCTEDVKINVKVWDKFKRHLVTLYGTKPETDRFLRYMEFKLDCAREQERSRWKLDTDRCKQALDQLIADKAIKTEALGRAMPEVKQYKAQSKPAKPFKKDGTVSATGARWFALLKKNNLPENYDGTIDVLVGSSPANPGSHVQVKEWLFSLGWVPTTFKFEKDKETGDVRKIPQVNAEHGAGICDSIKRLYGLEPSLELLDGLGVISHRISILNGFLSSVDTDGYIQAQIQGLTNTLRFKHKTAVNLPKAGKPYGELIRGCLIAPEGWELCGSDMASLEDRLKQHYIYPHDPEYVEEMNIEGYDPHLSLALSAGEVSQIAIDAYKNGTDKSIRPIRDIFKNGNYACQYGAGPPRLALTANIPLRKAEQVHKAYWKKNWAIKVVAKEQKVKTIKGMMWLLNPINKFWYYLKYEKDIFSTLVQGSASYVFDLWAGNFREVRSQLTAQFHDEVVLCVKKGFRFEAACLLISALNRTNEQLNLNRKLGIDVQFGDNYSEIH